MNLLKGFSCSLSRVVLWEEISKLINKRKEKRCMRGERMVNKINWWKVLARVLESRHCLSCICILNDVTCKFYTQGVFYAWSEVSRSGICDSVIHQWLSNCPLTAQKWINTHTQTNGQKFPCTTSWWWINCLYCEELNQKSALMV